MNKNLYKESWKLYKAHSESFTEDQEYYYDFCKNYKSLELFAGFGRLSNFLLEKNVNLEVVELEKEFTNYIKLNKSRIHVDDVLHFSHTDQFERIIAGYNSFCLFINEVNIKKFFSQIESLLAPGGYASLNYFHTDYWKETPLTELYIEEEKVNYQSTFDLSRKNLGYATWIDLYEFPESSQKQSLKYEYPVRVYNNANDLRTFYSHTSLQLIDAIENFGLKRNQISEPGWIDYIFIKKS